MIQYLLRLAKRFAVLIPGVIIAIISVRDVFPYFDRKLPLGFAILVTYALGAYVFVPALIRFFRVFRPATHLPLYCVTPDGFASDPLNIGIVGTRQEIIDVMEQSGWHQADPHSGKYLIKYGLSMMLGWQYDNAPLSKLYLFGRKQDLAFEIPIDSVSHRHHVRFWATTFNEGEKLSVRTIHWNHRRSHLLGDTLLWVGAASLDVGIAPIRHNLQLTHMIHPDTNKERELIVSQLETAGVVKKTEDIKLEKPYRLVNRAFRGSLHTDGVLTIVRLKAKSKVRRNRSRNR